MKKLLYAFLIMPMLAMAQVQVDNQWKTAINPFFQNLDKSKIQSGMLLDYAMEFTNVEAYNGTLTDSTDINANVVGDIYKTLFMSKVVADTTHTPLFNRYAYNWARARHNATKDSSGVYVLTGLLYEYQRFNENALAQNKITVSNDKYYDKYIRGVWQNPYETKRTFALTPPITHSRSKDIYFKLPNELFLSNLNYQITNIQLDADNGQGYQNLPFDNIIPIQFFENKIHELTFKVTLTSGQILYCRSKFKIEDPVLKRQQQQARGVIVVNDERIYIHEDNDFFSAAWLTIRRIPGNTEITRPLIIAEGLDTGKYTSPEDFGGDSTLADFNRSLLNSGNLFNVLRDGTNDYDLIYVDWVQGMGDIRDNSRVLEEVIGWVNDQKALSGSTEPNVLLGQSMGGVVGRYTLARMEQEGSTHDVRLFIAHDSPMQGANTPLAFQHFSEHMKEEYVSSPILWLTGEVLIPIGLGFAELGEEFLNAFGGNNDNIPAYITPGQLLSLQSKPAALQLNYWSAVRTGGTHLQTRSFNQTWQQTLDAMGWPTQSRNIAISNGNECGVDNGFAPGAQLLDIDSRSNPGFLLDMLNWILAPTVGAVTLDPGLILVGLIPGRSRWQTNFDFNTYGVQGSKNRIYRGRIRFEKKVLWIGPTIKYDVTNKKFYAPQEALPFDTYSGGRFNFFDNDGDFALDIPILSDLVEVQNDFYGFIPTVSALDIRKTSGNDPTPDDYLKSYSGGIPSDTNLISSFDNFIVDNVPNQPFNNEHISFQVRNGDWLADELNADPSNGVPFPVLDDCNWACDSANFGISGVDQFCTGARTFSVPAGADSYQWQFFPDPIPMTDDPLIGNATIISATNTNILGVSHTGNRSGWYNLRVVINSTSCDVQNLILTKRVYIGAPTVDNISVVSESEAGVHLSPGINNCEVALGLNFNPNNNDITDIEWEKITTDIAWSRDYVDYDDRYVYLFPECNKEFKFRVRAKNSCGFWSPWRELTYDITECSTTCQTPTGNIVSDNFILYPIPANTILNFGVQLNNTWNFPSSSPFVNLNDLSGDPTIDGAGNVTYPRVRLFISFYNSMGNLIHSTTIQGLPNQIDVSGIPTGNYIMRIEYLGLIETHNIQIN